MGKERNLMIDRSLKTLDPKYNNSFVRKMTPREWARLQGYPDDFKIHPIDTHAYKQLGNSVTVPVVTAIAENMLKTLNSSSRPDSVRIYGLEQDTTLVA